MKNELGSHTSSFIIILSCHQERFHGNISLKRQSSTLADTVMYSMLNWFELYSHRSVVAFAGHDRLL